MERQADVNLNLRLASSLHERLVVEAKQFERSLQREIVWRLRQSLEQQQPT
jgi:predicted HicB family RNase H-like nuclease